MADILQTSFCRLKAHANSFIHLQIIQLVYVHLQCVPCLLPMYRFKWTSDPIFKFLYYKYHLLYLFLDGPFAYLMIVRQHPIVFNNPRRTSILHRIDMLKPGTHITAIFSGIWIYILKIKWSWNSLIFIIEMFNLASRRLYIEHPPGHVFTKRQHYDDVIMDTMASQITSLTIVYSTVYSDTDQRKHQISASLAFVRGIHRGPVNSPHKWPVTQKMFPFDDVIM